MDHRMKSLTSCILSHPIRGFSDSVCGILGTVWDSNNMKCKAWPDVHYRILNGQSTSYSWNSCVLYCSWAFFSYEEIMYIIFRIYVCSHNSQTTWWGELNCNCNRYITIPESYLPSPPAIGPKRVWYGEVGQRRPKQPTSAWIGPHVGKWFPWPTSIPFRPEVGLM